ncbi:hypothetical protein [Nonomuraea sediminis]|uniref:hypothetical protein n=1 Tax=Nonomuraea sediminis TaxID=2835864 RepID=UPI001BDD5D6E|nr:hypothetical protein [Nonomuraea sediminis]
MRNPAPWLVAGGLAQAAAGIAAALIPALGFDSRSPAWWTVLLALVHVPQAVGFVLLALRVGGFGYWTTAVAVTAFVPAELVAFMSLDATGTVFAILTPVAGIGLVVAGISDLRRRVGLGRHVTLVAGLYVFVVLIPCLVALGPVAAVLAIGGWGVCFALIGGAQA